jgi:hypothetical protein
MLDSEVVVNLLPELGVGVDFVSHGTLPGERFKCSAPRRPALAPRTRAVPE